MTTHTPSRAQVGVPVRALRSRRRQRHPGRRLWRSRHSPRRARASRARPLLSAGPGLGPGHSALRRPVARREAGERGPIHRATPGGSEPQSVRRLRRHRVRCVAIFFVLESPRHARPRGLRLAPLLEPDRPGRRLAGCLTRRTAHLRELANSAPVVGVAPRARTGASGSASPSPSSSSTSACTSCATWADRWQATPPARCSPPSCLSAGHWCCSRPGGSPPSTTSPASGASACAWKSAPTWPPTCTTRCSRPSP